MNRKQIIRQLRCKNIAFDANASTADLAALLPGAVNKVSKTFNYAGGRGQISVAFNAKAEDEPAEIMICEEIGQDPWSGEGITVKDIKAALDAITPKTRTLDFFTNSPGGSVNEGTSIRNLLGQWPGRITNTIIGIAASTASWCIPADETRAYKSSQMFLHRSWGMVMGNADDMRDAITFLETTDQQIAQMLADQSEGTPEEMMDLMRQETLLTGQQAKDLGLVDVLIDGEAKNLFTPEQLNAMKSKLAALNTLRTPQNHPPPPATGNQPTTPDNIMNRDKMIALLNKWGVTIPANATDEQLLALIEAGKPTPTPAPANAAPPAPAPALSAEDKTLLTNLRNQVAENRKKEIRNRLTQLASADGGHRIPVNQIEEWEQEALRATDGPDGNPILNRLAQLPATQPGVAPINDLQITGESFADVQKFCLENGPRFRSNFLGKNAQNTITDRVRVEFGQRAVAVANAIAKNKSKIIEAWNSNTIDSALQRQVILQDMLEAYALRLIVLQAFSVKYDNVPLQGTDQVVVPYFPLQTNASVQFVKGTGYTTANDWTENSRSITIGGDGDAATSGSNATAGTAKDRLYQRIDFTSYDMRRQPYLNVAELCKQAADKLGVDVLTQIISRVVVTGNFGAAVKTVAAALFTPDDVADLSEYADTAQWPEMARSLVLQNTYKTPLLKDSTFKQYLSYGSTDPIRKAQIQEAYGFENMYFIPLMTNYTATNVAGWINHKSAVLCGFAPIMPAEGVRALLSAYEVIVNPASGAVLEYRKMANATTDTEQEIFQSCFGAGKGVDAALKIVKNA